MKPGHVYRNKLMRDVDWLVTSVSPKKIEGTWLTRRNSMPLGVDTLPVSAIKDSDWEDVTEEHEQEKSA
jgi:hypothetical protein